MFFFLKKCLWHFYTLLLAAYFGLFFLFNKNETFEDASLGAMFAVLWLGGIANVVHLFNNFVMAQRKSRYYGDPKPSKAQALVDSLKELQPVTALTYLVSATAGVFAPWVVMEGSSGFLNLGIPIFIMALPFMLATLFLFMTLLNLGSNRKEIKKLLEKSDVK